VLVKKFFYQFPQKTYPKGKLILSSIQPTGKIFYLQQGLIRQYTVTPDGEELTIHIFRPLSYFPLMLILGGVTNSYNFVTESRTLLREAPAQEAINFLRQNPPAAFELLQRYAAALCGLSQRLEKITTAKSKKSVSEIILYLSAKFGIRQGQAVILPTMFSHKMIASWTSLSRETVSRQIEEMQKKGLVEYRKRRLVIKNLDLMRTEDTGFLWE